MSDSQNIAVLGLSEEFSNDFVAIKSAYTKKVRALNATRENRSKYNLAYEYFQNRIFNVKESSDEKAMMTAICKGNL